MGFITSVCVHCTIARGAVADGDDTNAIDGPLSSSDVHARELTLHSRAAGIYSYSSKIPGAAGTHITQKRITQTNLRIEPTHRRAHDHATTRVYPGSPRCF
jgi:hypothetical protein